LAWSRWIWLSIYCIWLLEKIGSLWSLLLLVCFGVLYYYFFLCFPRKWVFVKIKTFFQHVWRRKYTLCSFLKFVRDVVWCRLLHKIIVYYTIKHEIFYCNYYKIYYYKNLSLWILKVKCIVHRDFWVLFSVYLCIFLQSKLGCGECEFTKLWFKLSLVFA